MTLGKQSLKVERCYYYPYVLKSKHKEKYELIMRLGKGNFDIGFKEFENLYFKYLDYFQNIIYKYDSLDIASKKSIRDNFARVFNNYNYMFFHSLRNEAFNVPEKINIRKFKKLEKIYNEIKE